MEVLAAAAELSDGSGLVFPGMRPGRPLSENTHAKLLREMGFDAVTHGFRSGFRDYAAEQTHTPHAVMEAALTHVIRNKADTGLRRCQVARAGRDGGCRSSAPRTAATFSRSSRTAMD